MDSKHHAPVRRERVRVLGVFVYCVLGDAAAAAAAAAADAQTLAPALTKLF